MAAYGKTIRIFLVDGVASGLWAAEIMNWTGKVLVAPRAALADLAKRPEAKGTGIYCLVGPDPDHPGRECVYIGEGDSVIARLKSHDQDPKKDFWIRVILVVSKDENITKSHGRYLEARLIDITTAAGRASLANGTAHSPPSMPEADVADMEFFIDQIRLIFPVLGFSFLNEKVVDNPAQPDVEKSPVFTIPNKQGYTARMRVVGNQFVVLKGSTARASERPSWTSYKALRSQLIDDGKLILAGDSKVYTFTEDVEFSSPSGAGAVCMGGNANGNRVWMLEHGGMSYGDWSQSRVEAAESSSGIQIASISQA